MSIASLTLTLDAYLAVRSAMGAGATMRVHERLLRSFVRYVEERGEPGPIRAQIAFDWACSTGDRCGPAGRACRLSVARKFLVYVQSIEPTTEIPGRGLLAAPRRRQPFLFTSQELRRLIEAATSLGPNNSLRPVTAATIVGLLASTGLRPSEALHLDVADVDLDKTPACLVIRQAKFSKSRLVPLHPTTAEQLKQYRDRRAEMGYAGLSDAFFVSERGAHLSYAALNRLFHRLIVIAKIEARPSCRQPSLHSFRHSFAVARIVAWLGQGVDVHRQLPNLSVYLGHVDVAASYWYLTATPEMLLHAGRSFGRGVGREEKE